MPSRFSSAGSIDDSVELAAKLGCRLETIPIEGPFSSFLATMEPHFAGLPFGLTEENLQARVRGDILMAVITSYSIHYTKLYDPPWGGIRPRSRRPSR